jgi:hypothetical protein
MEPLSPGASLPSIQDYVAKMEAERGRFCSCPLPTDAGSTLRTPSEPRNPATNPGSGADLVTVGSDYTQVNGRELAERPGV